MTLQVGPIEIEQSADGNDYPVHYFSRGHYPAKEFREACLAWEQACNDNKVDPDVIEHIQSERVQKTYWKDVPIDGSVDSEACRYVFTHEHDAGAYPVTIMDAE